MIPKKYHEYFNGFFNFKLGDIKMDNTSEDLRKTKEELEFLLGLVRRQSIEDGGKHYVNPLSKEAFNDLENYLDQTYH